MRLFTAGVVIGVCLLTACTPGLISGFTGTTSSETLAVCSSLHPDPECERADPRVDTTPLGFSYQNFDQHGNPVRWRKCSHVPYRILLEEASDEHVQVVHDAFAEVSRHTGLRFVHQPNPQTRPTGRGGVPGSGGGVVVRLGSAEQIPELQGSVAGLAAVSWRAAVSRGEPGEIFSARVMLDTDSAVSRMTGAGSFATIALHEIGHAVNLGHVPEDGALMRTHLNRDLPGVFPQAEQAGLRLLYTPQDC